MLEIIETLLVLQDRDRTIVQGRAEIVGLEIERVSVNERSTTAEAAQADAEQTAKELEVKKNALEMEAAGEQTKIITYSKQQLETKDNTQYRALVKQIDDCKQNISNFETDELMVLEEMDAQTETLKQTKVDLDAASSNIRPGQSKRQEGHQPSRLTRLHPVFRRIPVGQVAVTASHPDRLDADQRRPLELNRQPRCAQPVPRPVLQPLAPALGDQRQPGPGFDMLAGAFDQIGDHFDIILDHRGLARASCLAMVIGLQISVDKNRRALGFRNMRPKFGGFGVDFRLGIH